MGPSQNEFYEEIVHLREQQAMHCGLSANFCNPEAAGMSRSVWSRGSSFWGQPRSRNRNQQSAGSSSTGRLPQQQQACQQRREHLQQGHARGAGNRRWGRGRFHAGDSSSRGPAPSARLNCETQRVGAPPGSFFPSVAGAARRLPCVTYTWEWSHAGLVYTSSINSTPISFSTRNTPQDLQTAMNKLLSQGAIKPVFCPETKGFFSRLFLVPKKIGDLHPVIDLSCLNEHLVIPQFKMVTQASVRSAIRETNGLCPLTYRTHICTFPWQGLYRNMSSSWSTVNYISLLVSRSAWPLPLGNLPSYCDRGPVTVAARGQAPCLPGWLAYPCLVLRTGQNSCRFGTASAAAPGLGDQFQQVQFVTQSSIRFHRHAIQYVHLHRGTPAQNAGQNPAYSGSLEVTPACYRERPPQTFGHVDFHGQASAKRPPPNSVVGVRGLVSGDRVLVRQDFSAPDHSPWGGLVGLPCGAAGGLTKCPRDRDYSVHRCLQPRMGGAARFPYTAGDVVPAAGEPTHQSVRDGGSNLECSRVSASTQVSGSVPHV